MALRQPQFILSGPPQDQCLHAFRRLLKVPAEQGNAAHGFSKSYHIITRPLASLETRTLHKDPAVFNSVDLPCLRKWAKVARRAMSG